MYTFITLIVEVDLDVNVKWSKLGVICLFPSRETHMKMLLGVDDSFCIVKTVIYWNNVSHQYVRSCSLTIQVYTVYKSTSTYQIV